MMSANEFFDFGPEPPWLVDACEGEVLGQNFELEFSLYHGEASSSSAPFHELNDSGGAGPSNSSMQMDLDEDDVSRPSDFSSMVNNPRQEFERFLQDGNFGGTQSVRPPVGLSVEREQQQQQQQRFLRTTSFTLNGPTNRVPTRTHAPPSPAADQFFRACKKRKRSYA
ncbi:unnamed protein product [Calypogeia fissa]